MKPLAVLFLFLAASLGACKSPSSSYDRETGMKVEELGMAGYTYGSGKNAFTALHTSAIGPCFVPDEKAWQADEKAHQTEPDRWQLSYTASTRNVSTATIDSWNKSHASGHSRAKLDSEGLACLEADVTFTKSVRLTRKELFQQFAREVREFNTFLKTSSR